MVVVVVVSKNSQVMLAVEYLLVGPRKYHAVRT
jgi:hypothetical protein